MADTTAADASAASEAHAARKIRSTTLELLAAVWFIALVFTGVASWGAYATACGLALALTVVGYIAGLLFSIPRALAVGSDLLAATAGSGDGKGGSGTPPASQLSKHFLSVNTNLEQVSDWLTKIIVGVGLVEANNVKTAIMAGARLVGTAIGKGGVTQDVGTLIGIGIIVAYPGLGFLLGFFSVRLYISRAMWISDAVLSGDYGPTFSPQIVDELKRTTPVASTKGPREDIPATTVAASAGSVKEALDVPLSALNTVDDMLTRARAAQQRGLSADARAAYLAAITLDPTRMDAVLAYVNFLFTQAPVDYSEMVTRLEDARRSFTPNVPDDVRNDVTRELLNAYLYVEPPYGFQSAIRVGNEYVAGIGAKNPDAYVYLAAAHGQAYAFFKERDPAFASSSLQLVLVNVARALTLGGAPTKQWLNALTQDGVDNDLRQAAADSEELRRLLE